MDNGRNREQYRQDTMKAKSPSATDCIVCYENQVDCVLYQCGHMCLCYTCARELWRGQGGGLCPCCRASIRDVVRIYKSWKWIFLQSFLRILDIILCAVSVRLFSARVCVSGERYFVINFHVTYWCTFLFNVYCSLFVRKLYVCIGRWNSVFLFIILFLCWNLL